MPEAGAEDNAAFLVALATGCARREYRLAAGDAVVGRDGLCCEVVVAGATVSRRHLRIGAQGAAAFCLEDLDSTNGVFVNGHRIDHRVLLHDGDLIGLGTATPHLRFQRHSSSQEHACTLAVQPQWTIGRDPDSDLPLSFDPTVSGRHAVLANEHGTLVLLDQHSLNGTWVNGRAVRRTVLAPADTAVIGSTRFCLRLEADGSLAVRRRENGQALRLEGLDLGRDVAGGNGKKRALLDRITLAIAPGEFVGIIGPSGAGKTTLLTALCGAARPDRGQVLLDGTDLDTAAMFRNAIGYVPQDDILHPELSVEASLDYIARLRLSPDLAPGQRADIVTGAIETLGLGPVRQTPICRLSGGQRKRVSIGAELLVRPGLLFLDEPTSGLDPCTEERLMRHFRRMADQGTTVVVTTHVLANLDLLDKVAVLAQGRLAFFGPPAEALVFFGEQDKPLESPGRIFELLAGEEGASGQEEIAGQYADFFGNSPFFQTYVARELSPVGQTLLSAGGKAQRPGDGWTRAHAALGRMLHRFSLPESCRAWLILSCRHLQIRFAASRRLLLLLLVPVVLALVTLSQPIAGMVADKTVHERKEAISATMAHGGPATSILIKQLLAPDGPRDPRSAVDVLHALRHEGVGHLPVPMSVLLMIVMTAVFTGTLIACLEISPERSIYRRERMSHLRIVPYLGSKLPFCLAMTAGQCLVFVALCWLHPVLRQLPFASVWLVMVAVAWSSVAIGLLLSAADPSDGRFSVMLAIVVVLPQLLLSGGLGPDFYGRMSGGLRWAADLLPARWGLAMVCTALFGSLEGEGARWIPALVREVIGFDFGRDVYYSGLQALSAQSVLWLLGCAGILRYRDSR
ncbi:MAG: ATP-binding cassette domain-containing protein [Desulfobulbus sp.]|jgi:ABC-type multidrug transport system ATPase subunit/pSer/pThr/pTyr-binding forkhead associated (FHA) protein/ABC-type multidrug transport system permease subunit|uniref:FHA domain-containing protein n=1 Tax=Desulfobulbus sp. TaxID=895 RepID=UPI002851162D|nr:FHA domain-containing protein [Desulfobulbus sp.]MDR2551296.1 ATP-binding cassette domain-containing protein [Desulfobulbus sp.]